MAETTPENNDELDPPKRAIGLKHEGTASPDAPRIVASGTGSLAERILAIAEEHGVPVRHDPDLVEMLASAEVGEEIPVEVYGAVAGLLTFLYRLNEGCKPGEDSQGESTQAVPVASEE